MRKITLKRIAVALGIILALAVLWIGMDFPPGIKARTLDHLRHLAWFKFTAESPPEAPSSGTNMQELVPPPALQPPPAADQKPPPKQKPATKPAKAEKKAKAKKPKAKAKPKPAIQEPSMQAHEWKHWGAAPYARSFEESCQKAPVAIDGFNMPQAVKDHFKQVVGTACTGGTEDWLKPHQRQEQMWSGPDKSHRSAHVMNNVTVAELPVLKSPDGRTYRKGAVAETAKALSWTYTYEGKTYVLSNPFACFNWTWAYGPPPVAAAKEAGCAKVHVKVPAGASRTVRFTTIRRTPIPDFNCWGVIEREWRTGSANNCDWCEWTRDGVLEMGRRYGGRFEFFHTSIYQLHPNVDASGNMRETEVTLVFPLDARTGGIAVCVEVNGVIVPAYLILPDSWKGAEYRIPEDFFRKPQVVGSEVR